MKVLILGSNGQIGAYLTEYLKEKGHDVREFDVSNGEEQDLTTIPNPQLHAAIMTADFVYFLAFDVGGSHYLKKYQHTFGFIDNNTRMMANAFEYIQKYLIRSTFISVRAQKQRSLLQHIHDHV